MAGTSSSGLNAASYDAPKSLTKIITREGKGTTSKLTFGGHGTKLTSLRQCYAALLPLSVAAAIFSLKVSMDSGDIQLPVTHRGETHTYTFPSDATISDLSTAVSDRLAIPPSNQKFMISPKIGLLKPPFKDPDLKLQTVLSKKIVLLGSSAEEVASLNNSIQAAQSRSPRRSGRVGGSESPVKPASPAPSRNRDWKKVQEEAIYTFTTLRPLPYLPKPERSLRFLERLRDDAGIKASMRKHKWTVPLLTEMDPIAHTNVSSEGVGRTLGLNRNRGEVIELRLRTDAYDGYRDYKTIRKTLCHELAHNVWGEHDRNFWNLCHEIEKEVEQNDWRSGGHALTNQEFYNPDDRGFEGDYEADHGGWTGGEYVLGSSSGQEKVQSTAGGEVEAGNLSRRDIMARAAEERIKQQKKAERYAGAGDGAQRS